MISNIKNRTYFQDSMTSLLSIFKAPQERPPVWLMRQAGRYLPEYRELRATVNSFMDAALTPSVAAEITLQPIRRYPELSAAIIFSDILVTPYALGMDLQFVKGEGPQLPALDTTSQDLVFAPEKLEPIYEALRIVRHELPADKTLIGFAGSPWTVACYMICGGNHDDFAAAKRWAFMQPDRLDAVIAQLVDITSTYLIAQVKAGANMLQLFESWAGLLAGHVEEFHRFIITPTQEIIKRVKQACPDTPIIGFPKQPGNTLLMDYAHITGMDGLGLDWSVDLEWAAKNIPDHLVLQGNLDPQLVVAGGPIMHAKTDLILKAMQGRRHIFNLGHGIVPQASPDHVAALLRHVATGDNPAC